MAISVGTMLAIQAGTTLISGFLGGSQADRSNKQAQKNYEKQQKMTINKRRKRVR